MPGQHADGQNVSGQPGGYQQGAYASDASQTGQQPYGAQGHQYGQQQYGQRYDHSGQQGQPYGQQPYGQQGQQYGQQQFGQQGQNGAGQQWNSQAAVNDVKTMLRQPDGSLHVGNAALAGSLVAQLFVLLGSVGPWASVFGMSASGLSGDGWLTLILALVSGGLVVASVLGKLPAKALWGAVGASALSFLVAVLDINDYMAWGLSMVLLFSAVATGALVVGTLPR